MRYEILGVKHVTITNRETGAVTGELEQLHVKVLDSYATENQGVEGFAVTTLYVASQKIKEKYATITKQQMIGKIIKIEWVPQGKDQKPKVGDLELLNR